jgi:mutator protein MutT
MSKSEDQPGHGRRHQSDNARAASNWQALERSEDEVVVLAAVIRQGTRYLVARRPAHKRHGGLWEFPGGKVLAGETWIEAARRELDEELGVRVRSVADPLHWQRDTGSEFVIVFVPVEIEGEPRCIEHTELLWASLDELTRLDLAPADRSFVEQVNQPTD